MVQLNLQLPDELHELLKDRGQPVDQAAIEMIVMDLYRREIITSGKGAELLGWSREKFITISGDQGIPFFRLSDDELDNDVKNLEPVHAAPGHR